MNTPIKTPRRWPFPAGVSALLIAAAQVSAAFQPAVARLELDRRQALAGQPLQATYTFRSSGPSESDMTVFVHVVRPDGRHIGADFEPDLPTTQWPRDRFVREGPFLISVPEDAAPGRYQIWVGMFSPDGGERIEFANAEHQRGHREYHVGDFEVVAAHGKVEAKPTVFNWQPVDETQIVQAQRRLCQPAWKRWCASRSRSIGKSSIPCASRVAPRNWLLPDSTGMVPRVSWDQQTWS